MDMIGITAEINISSVYDKPYIYFVLSAKSRVMHSHANSAGTGPGIWKFLHACVAGWHLHFLVKFEHFFLDSRL